MGVAAMHWRFPEPGRPDLGAISDAVCAGSGLRAERHEDWTAFPEIGDGIRVGETDEGLLEIRTAAPANPYLWRQVALALTGLGGEIDWPDIEHEIWPRGGTEPACLSQRWDKLSATQRLILRRGSLHVFRPFDGLL